MQVEEQQQKKLSAITHSPYYGCTVRVLSKAHVSYEGVLDGISANKDRIYLKDVHVNANLATSPDRNKPTDTLEKSSTSDTLNAVMIDHLTTDIHTYEHVCLNVRDIKELRLIQLPSTFNDSKAKLRAIDPCLVDIRLSSSDDYERQSNGSPTNPSVRAPIARQRRGESLGSTGDNLLVSSSSNESSSPSYDRRRSSENVADESNDESIDEQIEKFNRLTTSNSSAKPVTLLAKKILPKKIERRTDIPAIVTSNGNQSAHQQVIDDSTRTNDTTMTNNNNTTSTIKKDSTRKESPVRVTITSQLNPNAIPFYAQQRKLPAVQNPSFTFYERPRFRPRLPTVVSPDRAQTVPYGRNPVSNNNQQQRPPHHPQQPNSYQRFVPLRQMAMKKNVTQNSSPRTNTRPNRAPPPPIAKYRFHSTNSLNKRTYPQQQQQQQHHQKQKPPNNIHGPELMRQTSLPPENQLFLIPAGQSNLFQQRNNPIHQSTTSIHSTASLPYHYGSSVDHNQRLTPVSVGEPIGSRRNQRTCSMASSCSSVSVDIGPHSIIQFDSSSPKVLPSFDEQYDFEKANEEFRRYLELEELVTRRTSSHCSMGSSTDINASQQQAQAHSYKKDISFFDHISCTATTGTAVGYTEMDETEKNLETFGDDALLLASKSTDNEWQI